MSKHRILYLAALLLPILALAGMAGFHTWHRHNAPQYKVVVEAYDPRDIVYGEYLQLRIDWKNPASEKPAGADIAKLPERTRIYLPEGNSYDLQEMLFEKRNVFTATVQLRGQNIMVRKLEIDAKPWPEALAAWRQNRDNKP